MHEANESQVISHWRIASKLEQKAGKQGARQTLCLFGC
jgi:hypothetical protein